MSRVEEVKSESPEVLLAEDDLSSTGEFDELSRGRCCPGGCGRLCRKKSLWNRSQGSLQQKAKEETKYPLVLTILEHPGVDILSVVSAVASLFLLFVSEGFLIEGTLLWGVLHSVNALYSASLFARYLHLLLKSKFAKAKQRYSLRDVALSFLSVLPLDIFFLAYHSATTHKPPVSGVRGAGLLWLTPIRVLYLFRIRTVFHFFAKLEDQLGIGDLWMFIGRATLYTASLVHFMACAWHRIHCEGIVGLIQRRSDTRAVTRLRNYEECYAEDWIQQNVIPQDDPFHSRHTVLTHYFVSLYWATLTTFRLGASSFNTHLNSDWEVAFSAVSQIIAWIFIITYISGGLTSLLVEFDTEREKYLTRRFAIDKFLDFSDVSRRIRAEVNRFYDYLWTRSRGIHNWDLVRDLPLTMKSEIYYDINKFIMDQLPLISNLGEGFLMSLSVRMKHNFFLKGEVLRRRGQNGSTLFYVISGYLEVLSADGSFVLGEIRSGSAIGELTLLQSSPCVSTVRCGTESDIMTLTKKDFNDVLASYPENRPILLHRLETRLEQSGLLLALCKKSDKYPAAFKNLSDLPADFRNYAKGLYKQSFDAIDELLDSSDVNNTDSAWKDSDDFDDLNLSPKTFKRIRKLSKPPGSPVEKRNTGKELEAAACAALEADVNRATALAKDLNISRPPCVVKAPRNAGVSTAPTRFSMRDRIVPKISEKFESRKWSFILWKFVMTASAVATFWFYSYQVAFADHRTVFLNYAWHIFDLVLLVDFLVDMFLRTVNTPQRPLENPLEIGAFRAKTFDFWFRLLTFLPFEYALGPLLGWSPSSPRTARLYYILKLNRVLQYRAVVKFFSSFDGDARFSPVAIVFLRFIVRLFYVIHSSACLMEVILKATHTHRGEESVPELMDNATRAYEFVFYWASEVTTGTGFGDIQLKSSCEFAISGVGLVVGSLTLVFLNARVSCIMVNAERKRVAFKTMYYALRTFMRERRFPKWLSFKVTNYFRMQWTAHEGTLIPHQQNAIWDAPKTLFNNVCLAQGQKYVQRIPLFKYCNEGIVLEVCSALKQYFLPPHQVVLYPSDRARDLYVIVKGYCEVTYKGTSLGTLTEGRYVGLPGLIYGCNKPAQIATLTHAQLFCLHFDDFVRISKKYPKFLSDFKTLRGEVVRKERPQLETEEDAEEIPLPSVDAFGRLPPLFDAVEVEDGDGDSIAEKKSIEAIDSSRNSSFVWTPYSSVLSWFFVPVTLLPNGGFLKWWTVFRVLCALVVGNFVPIQAAFPVQPTTAFATVFFFDAVAWVDMVVCFHIGFYGKENLLVTERVGTVAHYLGGPFLLDILGCFPFDHFLLISNFDSRHFFTEGARAVSVARLNRMIQLYRIFVCGKLLSRSISKSLSFLTLLQVVPLMFLFLNVMSCVAFALVCRPSHFHNATLVLCHPNAWIMDGSLYAHNYDALTALKDTVLTYIISFYFVTESSFCVGFGDLNIVQSAVNRKFTIVLIISGAVVSGYLVSKLTACLVGEDSRRIAIRDRTKILFRYLEHFKVPRDLRRRVKEACFAEWDKTKGILPQDLFHALPPSLKCDSLKRLYEVSLRQSPLFKDLDKPGMRMLSSKLSEMIYPEGEFVFKYGDLNDDIFFIAKGVVVTYTKNGDVIRHIGAGSLLGEISPLFDIQRMFTTVAGSDAELYVFSKEDFLDFLSLYPHMRTTLEEACLLHYKETIDVTVGHSQKSQILLAEVGEDPLRLPAFLDDSVDNVNRKKKKNKAHSSVDKFQSWFFTAGRRPRDEMGLIHFVPDKSKLTWKSAVIHPASPICNYVSFYLFLTSLSCGLTAYEIAFSTVDGKEATPLLVVRVLMETFFVIRILGNFRLAFHNENSQLVSNSFLIAKRYALDPLGLWVDVLSTFPFYFVSHFSSTGSYRINAYVRGFEFLRMILFASYLRETESDLRMNTSRVRIIKVSIILCFIFHFCACAWYLVACNGLTCRESSWMATVILEQSAAGGSVDFPIGSRYLLALYYVCSAITFTGLGDVAAKLGVELLLTVLMIFITVFVIGFLVGEMTQCLASQVAAKMHFRHRLRVVQHHFQNLGLSESRVGEVRRYFMLLWMRCNGISYTRLLSYLPYSLRADLTMAVYGSNIKCSRMFGGLGTTIIRQLSAEIRHEIYMPGTHIVRSGDVCQAVYFIKKGEIVILDETPGVELCVDILYENDSFGEGKAILTGQPYRFSYVARLETEIGVLFHDDLTNVLQRHGRVYEDILDRARQLKEKKRSIARQESEKPPRQSTASQNRSLRAAASSAPPN